MDSDTKDLVPADWFQKPHDYTLFNYIIENIADLIDDLELKNTMFLLGAGTSDGGKYKGMVITSGYFNATDDVFCTGIFIVGKSIFDKLVIVDGNSRIAGRIQFKDYAIFGGKKTEIAGRVKSSSHIISSGSIKLDGRIAIDGNLYTDNKTQLKGEVIIGEIRSSSLIYVNGNLMVNGDINADEFILSKGGGEVDSINAKVVSIGFKDKRTARMYHNKAVERVNLANPITLTKYVVGMVKHGFSFKRRKYGPFHIKGTITADEIYLSNCIVDGDIVGKNITIGENVQIQGQITCSDKLELPAGKENEYHLSKDSSKITSG